MLRGKIGFLLGEKLTEIQKNIIELAYIIASIGGFFLIFLSYSRSALLEMEIAFYIYLFLYILPVVLGFFFIILDEHKLLFFLYISFHIIAGVNEFVFFGNIGGGYITFISVSILITVLYGRKAGIVTLLIESVIIFIVAFLYITTNLVEPFLSTEYNTVPATWGVNFFGFVSTSVILIFIISKYNELIFQSNKDLQASNEKLKRQKNHLHDFAHELRHDITNNLGIISGYIGMIKRNCMKENKEIDQKTNQYFDIVTKQLNLVEDIMDKSIALADAGKAIQRSTVNLNQVLDEIEKIIPQDVTVHREYYTELESIYCDREKISQVFLNLVTNAIEHGKPDDIWILCKSRGNKYNVSITNNGKPISSNIASKLFKNNISVGYGTNIIQKNVEAHGWAVKVDQQAKNRTKIDIVIPKNERQELNKQN